MIGTELSNGTVNVYIYRKQYVPMMIPNLLCPIEKENSVPAISTAAGGRSPGRRILLTVALWVLLAASPSLAQVGLEYNSGAPLNELNVEAQGDAYPWLSSDGLRLYFTKQSNMSTGVIYWAERAALTDPFTLVGNALSGIVPGELMTCWLSQDELTIYFTSDTQLRKATRSSLGSPFTVPMGITLTGITLGTIMSPSFTPDGQQLFLFHGASGEIMTFSASGTDQYMYSGALLTGFEVQGPAKLHPSGLEIYFSGDNGQGHRIYRMTRSSLDQEFSGLEQFTGSVFDPEHQWMQPMIIADGSILVMVQGMTDWIQNDLYMAFGEMTTDVQEQWVEVVRHWPDPVSDILTINIPAGSDRQGADLLIMDMQGRRIRSDLHLQPGQQQLDVSAMAAGTYIFVISSGGEPTHRSTFTVVH